MRSGLRWACAVGLVAAAAQVAAQDPAPADDAAPAEAPVAPVQQPASPEATAATPAEAAPAAALPTMPADLKAPPPSSGQLSLSLHDAIARALENNLAVELFRYDPAVARYEKRAAWGTHEPVFYGTVDHSDASLPVAQVFQGFGFLTDKETTGATGVHGLLPLLGWQYDFSYSGSKTETSSTIQSLNPEYRANVTFAFTAPLLKGFLFGAPWIQVRIADKNLSIADEAFRQRLMDVVRGTEVAYWNLAAQSRNRDVARKSLETSTALLKQVEARYRVGVVSRVEVTEAEAGVADRKFQLIGAENLYHSAQDALIDTVFGPALTPTSSLELVTSDSPDEYQKLAIDPTVATEKALANRPELVTAQRAADVSRIRLQFLKNQRLPQLDVVASYGTHGLAGVGQAVTIGSTTIPAPVGVPDRYGDTHDQFFQGDNSRTWTAGARLSIPIGMGTARSDVRVGEIDLHKAETMVDQQRQMIVSEVRNAARDLESAIEGIEAAEEGLRSAQEQLRAEQIRLEHGESTPFDVLQREEALVRAESRRIGALTFYHISLVALDRAQGTLLEDRGIAVDGVKRERAPK